MLAVAVLLAAVVPAAVAVPSIAELAPHALQERRVQSLPQVCRHTTVDELHKLFAGTVTDSLSRGQTFYSIKSVDNEQ